MAKNKTEQKNKVLFFDDEPYITAALTLSLELLGWKVTLVSDIDKLFKELTTHQFDIIIMDIMAPIPNMENKYINFTPKEIDEMDMGLNAGVVLSKRIWKEFNENIPILFLSARRNPIPEDPELGNYKCAYLRKPQLAKEVDEKLHQMLNNSINKA